MIFAEYVTRILIIIFAIFICFRHKTLTKINNTINYDFRLIDKIEAEKKLIDTVKTYDYYDNKEVIKFLKESRNEVNYDK